MEILFFCLAFLVFMWLFPAYMAGSDPLFFLKKKIYLLDRWNDQYSTRINTDTNGVKWAYVYPFSKVGHVILNDDGTTSGECSYIQQWSTKRFDTVAITNARYK